MHSEDSHVAKYANISQVYKLNVRNINSFHSELSYLNFHPLKVVSGYRDPQLQVGNNNSYFNLKPNISKS